MICEQCGSEKKLQTHHIVYRSNGGIDDEKNLIHLCRDCHVSLHSSNGDYRTWGRIGGLKTAKNPDNWKRNLKQYRGKNHD